MIAAFSSAVPMRRRPGTSASRAVRELEQVGLVGLDPVEAYGLDIVERGCQPDGAGNVRRSSLELVGDTRCTASAVLWAGVGAS